MSDDVESPRRGLRPDAWHRLRDRTPARVALGRAGTSLPTAEVLQFALDHAEARDAVHATLDIDGLTRGIEALGRPTVRVKSAAVDGADYLRRPEKGRRLDDGSVATLTAAATDAVDVVLILADGLSATAANRHGVGLIAELLPRLGRLTVGPIVLASRARVALQDEIGHLLHARCVVILLGERPGLGAADSVGAYLVFDPKPGRHDAERNCVSNIRPQGLPLPAAADTLAYLIDASLTRRLSGVNLKDDRPRLLT